MKRTSKYTPRSKTLDSWEKPPAPSPAKMAVEADSLKEAGDGSVLDLSKKELKKVEKKNGAGIHTLILDHNDLTKLEHLGDSFPDLKSVSAESNRVIRMYGVARLHHLEALNLSNNELVCIEGLKELVHLTTLNLAGNKIKAIQNLQHCPNLVTLDLSRNLISSLVDISHLSRLQTLHLSHNKISSLNHADSYLPSSLVTLSLSHNNIADLNEVSHLSALTYLEQFSIAHNPCVSMTGQLPGFDYRPFVVNWCLGLRVLDGFVVSQKESLRAEWLYSQGKGRHFVAGEHMDLVEYLVSTCPMTSADELVAEEDEKLSRILQKQRQHKEQLLHEMAGRPPHQRSHSQDNVRRGGSVSVTKSPRDMPVTDGIAELLLKDKHGTIPENHKWPGHSPLTVEQVKSCYQQYEERVVRPNAVFSDSSVSCKTLPIRKVSSRRLPSPSTPHAPPTTSPRKSRKWRDRMSQSWCSETELKSRRKPASESDTEDCSLGSRIATLSRPRVIKYHPPSSGGSSDLSSYGASRIGIKAPERKPDVKRTLSIHSYLSPSTQERAAVKIQSIWRGYATRSYHPMAIAVRQEIRMRRMEDTIQQLREVVVRQQRELQQEKEFRRLQSEDIARLILQVKHINRDLSALKSLPSTPNRNYMPPLLQLGQPPPPPCQAPPPIPPPQAPPPAPPTTTPPSLFDSGIHSPSLTIETAPPPPLVANGASTPPGTSPPHSSTSEEVSSSLNTTVLPSPASSSPPAHGSSEFVSKIHKMEKIFQDLQIQFKDLQGMGLMFPQDVAPATVASRKEEDNSE